MSSPQPSARSRFGRPTRLLLVFAILVGGLVAVDASPAAAMLPPDPDTCSFPSSLNGSIHRSEVICRAHYWYSIRSNSDMTYDDPGDGVVLPYHWDYTQSRKYRRDCSGYVDMAWHLNSDHNTSALPNISTKLASWKDLKAGDILDYPGVHTILFAMWLDTAKTSFAYYSFGSTPVKYRTTTLTGGGDNTAGNIDSHAYTGYKPYRYTKILD